MNCGGGMNSKRLGWHALLTPTTFSGRHIYFPRRAHSEGGMPMPWLQWRPGAFRPRFNASRVYAPLGGPGTRASGAGLRRLGTSRLGSCIRPICSAGHHGQVGRAALGARPHLCRCMQHAT